LRFIATLAINQSRVDKSQLDSAVVIGSGASCSSVHVSALSSLYQLSNDELPAAASTAAAAAASVVL